MTKEQRRAYYASPDQRQKAKVRYQAKRDENIAYSREYRKTRNWQWACLKSSAKKRKILVTITFEQFGIIRGEDHCYYCGGPLPLSGCGVDRKNNDLGYIPGNCIPCCTICNSIKGSELSCSELLGVLWRRNTGSWPPNEVIAEHTLYWDAHLAGVLGQRSTSIRTRRGRYEIRGACRPRIPILRTRRISVQVGR
jgi:hypothetical protein